MPSPNKIQRKKKTLRATPKEKNVVPHQKDAIERAIEFGIDVTLLEQNLRMTPTRRLENFQRWLEFSQQVRQAGEAKRRNDAARREKLFDALETHQVEYVILGGIAAIAHGSATLTFDLDVCYARTNENLERVVRAPSPLNPYLRGAEPIAFQV